MSPYDRIQSLELAANLGAGRRKAEGITYTPPAIAKSMVSLLAPSPNDRILEPSCGRGVFVFALVEYWLETGHNLAWVDRWAQEHLFACDLDTSAIEDLQQLWQEYFQDHGHQARPLNAEVQDGLFGAWSDQRFNSILGNPPYVRIQNLPEATRSLIRTKYTSCAKGNVDLYYAFMEDALARAERVCLITPNSWLGNDSAKTLRQQLLPRLSVIIDFGSRLVFSPVRAYTAITLCEAQPGNLIQARGNLPEEGGQWQAVERNDPRWADARFTPLAAAQAKASMTLGDRFEVLSGIATLADHAFILPAPLLDGAGHAVQDDPLANGKTTCVPLAYAPRLVKITKPGALDQTGPRILYPYNAKGKIEEEATLRAKAPGLLDWLERRRSILEGRDKGKTEDYDAWFAYGRRQGLWTAGKNERLLLLPQMGNGALAPTLVQSQALAPFLFTSGFVLRAKPGQGEGALERLAQYLAGPDAWSFVQQEGKAWAGKGDYRTLGARALRRMPLPEDF